ncbi:response regulator transcription factor [Actinoallomurus bryophytorum]|uniref:DNA-binding NarL/FixJ family response regulator n=1 Tax=Actinoallomurus bryophytorum TaxID=1490222 RepID=A0A543CP97_9ACTN|nr:response regulator transcription factor [Actinoallomurus bryophytorum]TQL98928.1 DNA-binding NarL/FixJ family response regulator [Actinoallomurus bryophytorum]
MGQAQVGDRHAPTRVLLVEDQRTLAEALVIAIDAQPDMECVGAAESAEEALVIAGARRPDVVVMDIHLPGADGIAGTRRIKAVRPEARVFILTADATPELFADAVAAGAAGFLSKGGPFPDVLAAIRTSPGGRVMMAADTFAALVAEVRGGSSGQAGDRQDWTCLTGREKEVLALMNESLGAQAIAERLGVSPHTAHSHIKRVMAKLRAHTRREAIAVATRKGLLPGRG